MQARGPYILGFIAKSWGYGNVRTKESRVCTRIVSTGSEGIKQHELITIRGNRVGAGQVLRSVIDGVQSVFSLGLLDCLWTRQDDVDTRKWAKLRGALNPMKI